MITHRKGWCPGALQPMQSGDGLIVRLRITGGVLTPSRARALAQCAETFGNGLLDLTSRGNLQLRGVIKEKLSPLQARLDALGLLDEDPAAEAIRNILASPLAGIDPSALIDVRQQIRTLDARLRKDKALHLLPGKFLFVIDDGGCLPLPIEAADIAFVAMGRKDDPRFAVYLAGKFAGACATDELGETAARLAIAFLRLRDSDTDRMVDLVRCGNADAIAKAAELQHMPASAAPARRARPRVPGFHHLGDYTALGLGLPFGRFDSASLQFIADATEAAGGSLRLTPWRAILIVAERIDASLAERLRDAGFILDEDAPIRSVAACSGKPACLNGETAAQADAARLASHAAKLTSGGIALHVSACTKGCAHASPAPITLVGHDGAYDLVLNGRANDKPALTGLTPASVECLLDRLAKIAPEGRAAFVKTLFNETAQ
ncbi:MAG: precorrin-3B synthase [Beijerinckiaceae bacterium]|nr:MAG: precorrin-3B synthase [Beijerinckiaceae bacterium]